MARLQIARSWFWLINTVADLTWRLLTSSGASRRKAFAYLKPMYSDSLRFGQRTVLAAHNGGFCRRARRNRYELSSNVVWEPLLGFNTFDSVVKSNRAHDLCR